MAGRPVPQYRGWCEPEYPCRIMPTRHCPAVYMGQCGDRPCARYEADDQTPWLDEGPSCEGCTPICEGCGHG